MTPLEYLATQLVERNNISYVFLRRYMVLALWLSCIFWIKLQERTDMPVFPEMSFNTLRVDMPCTGQQSPKRARKRCRGGLSFSFFYPSPLIGKGKFKTSTCRAVLRDQEPHGLGVRGINPSSDNQSDSGRKVLNCDDRTWYPHCARD